MLDVEPCLDVVALPATIFFGFLTTFPRILTVGLRRTRGVDSERALLLTLTKNGYLRLWWRFRQPVGRRVRTAAPPPPLTTAFATCSRVTVPPRMAPHFVLPTARRHTIFCYVATRIPYTSAPPPPYLPPPLHLTALPVPTHLPRTCRADAARTFTIPSRVSLRCGFTRSVRVKHPVAGCSSCVHACLPATTTDLPPFLISGHTLTSPSTAV